MNAQVGCGDTMNSLGPAKHRMDSGVRPHDGQYTELGRYPYLA
jgi:hypothetical protein